MIGYRALASDELTAGENVRSRTSGRSRGLAVSRPAIMVELVRGALQHRPPYPWAKDDPSCCRPDQDRTRLENRSGPPAGPVVIDDGGDLAIPIEFQKLRSSLFTLPDVDEVRAVGEIKLLRRQKNF